MKKISLLLAVVLSLLLSLAGCSSESVKSVLCNRQLTDFKLSFGGM